MEQGQNGLLLLLKCYICMIAREDLVILFPYSSSSSSSFKREDKKTLETFTPLHSKSFKPLHIHAKQVQKHNHHPNSSKKPRKNTKKLWWIVAGLSACYSRIQECLFRVVLQFQAYTPSISSLVINVEAIFRPENA